MDLTAPCACQHTSSAVMDKKNGYWNDDTDRSSHKEEKATDSVSCGHSYLFIPFSGGKLEAIGFRYSNNWLFSFRYSDIHIRC